MKKDNFRQVYTSLYNLMYMADRFRDELSKLTTSDESTVYAHLYAEVDSIFHVLGDEKLEY